MDLTGPTTSNAGLVVHWIRAMTDTRILVDAKPIGMALIEEFDLYDLGDDVLEALQKLGAESVEAIGYEMEDLRALLELAVELKRQRQRREPHSLKAEVRRCFT